MRGEKGSNGEARRILPLAVVLILTLSGLVISAPVSPTSAGPPGLPLVVLYGNLNYSDGHAAPNVEVTVKNETSGISLSDITNENGVWSVTIEEGSQIGGCGDEVLIVAKDAWNNEVSKKVNIICNEQSPLQREDLAFDVPKPTATPSPSPPSDGGGSSSSGGGDVTPTPTPSPTPTPTPTPTPSPEATPTVSPTTAISTSTPSPVPTSSPGPTTSKPRILIPGFEAVFAISGLLAVAYAYSLMRRRRKV